MAAMEEWLENYGIFEKMDEISNKTERLTSEDSFIDTGSKHHRTLKRLEDVISYYERVLKSTDPILVSKSVVTDSNQHISRIINHLDDAISNQRTNNIPNIDDQIDEILRYANLITYPKTQEDFQDLKKYATKFRQSLSQQMNSVENQLSDLTDGIDQAKRKFEETVSEREEEVNRKFDNLEEKLSEYKSDLQDQKQRIDQKIDNIEERFTQGKVTRDDQFSDQMAKFEDDINEMTEIKKQDLEEEIDHFKNDAQNTLDEIREAEDEAFETLEAIGRAAITGGFQEAAEEQKNTADRWRTIGVWSLGFLVVTAVAVAALMWESPEFNWARLGAKLLLIGSISALATYAIKESAEHRHKSRVYRKKALELQSITPYLANLDDERRQKIKEELSQELFAEPVQELDPDKAPDGVGPLKTLDKLDDILQKVTMDSNS